MDDNNFHEDFFRELFDAVLRSETEKHKPTAAKSLEELKNDFMPMALATRAMYEAYQDAGFATPFECFELTKISLNSIFNLVQK